MPAWESSDVAYLGWIIGLRGLRGRWDIDGDFLRSLEFVDERFKVVDAGLFVNVKGDTGKGGCIGMLLLLLLGGDGEDDAVDFKLDALLLFLIVLSSYGFDVVAL